MSTPTRITIETLCIEISGLRPQDLHRWIVNAWVRPDGEAGQYLFRDIDVARVKLIIELRDHLEVTEPALPTVLSLLDQLYDLRRRLRGFNAALEETVPAELRAILAQKLSGSL